MRTTYAQFKYIISFMENHGDLSKATSTVQDRVVTSKWWKELTDSLNKESAGAPRPEEKWRKVWSDLKNNSKKKWKKLVKTGQGPPLTDLERRVLVIMNLPLEGVATEVVYKNDADQSRLSLDTNQSLAEDDCNPLEHDTLNGSNAGDEEWNTPGSSRDPIVKQCLSDEASSGSAVADDTTLREPKYKIRKTSRWRTSKKDKMSDEDKLFLEYRNAFDYERERDRRNYEIERERIRQRDEELKLQREWLELMKSAMGMVERFLNDRK